MIALLRQLRRIRRIGLVRDEIDEELQFHLSAEADRLQSSGLSPDEAKRLATATFGDVEVIRRECVRIRSGIMEDYASEIRAAARSLKQSRASASVAFAGLTAAIALLAAAFSTFDKAVLDPLPYPDADRIVRLWSSVPGIDAGARWGFATGQFQYVKRDSKAFASIGLYRYQSVTARIDGRSARVDAMMTTDGTLDVLGLELAIGRRFSPDDIQVGRQRTALISHSTWEKFYNRDRSIVGKSLSIDGSNFRIIGVLPADALFPEEIDEKDFPTPGILLPFIIDPAAPPDNHHVFRAIARLKPGVGIIQAQRELARLTRQLPERLPSAYSAAFMKKTGFAIEAAPLASELRSDAAGQFILMLAAAALLMAAACAVAWHVPVRDNWSRLTLPVAELAILVMCSAGVGLMTASLGLRLWSPVAAQPAHLTSRAIAFTLCTATIAAISMSWIRGSRNAVVVEHRLSILIHTGIAVIMLIGTSFAVKSVVSLRATSPGFNAANAVAATLHLPAEKYSSHESVAEFYDQLAARIHLEEGVTGVGVTNVLPLQGFDGCSGVTTDSHPGSRCVPVYLIGPGYLRALGATVVGRELRAVDEPAVVISKSFAAREWPGINPIGRTLRLGPSSRSYEVVGIVDDVKSRGLDRAAVEDVYVPLVPIAGWNGWPPITTMRVVIRGENIEAARANRIVAAAIRALDAGVTAEPAQSLESIVRATTETSGIAIPFIAVTTAAAVLLCVASLLVGIHQATGRALHPRILVQAA